MQPKTRRIQVQLEPQNAVEREESSHSYEMSDKTIIQNTSEIPVSRYC